MATALRAQDQEDWSPARNNVIIRYWLWAAKRKRNIKRKRRAIMPIDMIILLCCLFLPEQIENIQSGPSLRCISSNSSIFIAIMCVLIRKHIINLDNSKVTILIKKKINIQKLILARNWNTNYINLNKFIALSVLIRACLNVKWTAVTGTRGRKSTIRTKVTAEFKLNTNRNIFQASVANDQRTIKSVDA